MGQQAEADLSQFLDLFLSTTGTGTVCLCSAFRRGKKAESWQQFFSKSRSELESWIGKQVAAGRDVYFRVCSFREPRATSANAEPTKIIWADLDEAWPVKPPPTAAWETSGGRYQAIWLLSDSIPAREAESLSRALAYRVGADPSGWDCTQALRLPGTLSFKYEEKGHRVKLLELDAGRVYTPSGLPVLPFASFSTSPEPPTPLLATEILQRHHVSDRLWKLFEEVPKSDWSAALWRLEHGLFESGASADEVYSVCLEANCNKYRRDNRPDRDLWQEVKKAELDFKPLPRWEEGVVWAEAETGPPKFPYWLRRWIEHVQPLAPRQRPEVEACIFLSAFSVLWPQLRIENLSPCLWTLLLAPQGTGKSLSQRDAVDIVAAVKDILVVTGGSPEGLLQVCQDHESVLVAYDEYSGILQSMARRDSYLASLSSDLSSLYDGARIGHATRRASIFKRRPFVSLLATTTKESWQAHARAEDFLNGYLSRFLVLAADLLPDTRANHSGRGASKERLGDDLGQHLEPFLVLQDAVFTNLEVFLTGRLLSLRPVTGKRWEDGEGELTNYDDRLRGVGPPCSLDAAESADLAAVTGRMMAQARKIAVLLELLEEHPQTVGRETLVVRLENIKRACWLVDKGRAWYGRAARWLQGGEDEYLAKQIENRLRLGHHTTRDLQRRIHGANARRINEQLERVMLGSGSVHDHYQARIRIWGLGPREKCEEYH